MDDENRLLMNETNTEFLLIGTNQQLAKVNVDHTKVGYADIVRHSPVKNLGVWLDSNLSMVEHITKASSAAFFYLYNIHRIRKYLSKENTETPIHAFVSSRIDYCNSLLYGVPNCHLHKLQRVQNAAARLIFEESKYCHVTPLLKSLHWLPVKYRIIFKVLLITFKAIHGLALWWPIGTKHFPESKTLPRIQKHFPESKNTSQNPKTLPRIQNTSQNPKTLPTQQNTSQNPNTFHTTHFPESNTSHTAKHFP